MVVLVFALAVFGCEGLPAGDELEAVGVDCLPVASVSGVEGVDGAGGEVESGDAGSIG